MTTSYLYKPAGRAGEYAHMALNPYLTCGHRCVYCFAPFALHKTRAGFFAEEERKINWKKLQQELEKKATAGWPALGHVLLAFATDPYQPIETWYGTSRRAILLLKRFGFSICILTKDPARALENVEDLDPAVDVIGTTITTLDERLTRLWEPNAPSPNNRLNAMRTWKDNGFFTWMSLEPAISPQFVQDIIRETHPYADHYKIGLLNYAKTTPPLLQEHAAGNDWKKALVHLRETLAGANFTEVDAAVFDRKSFYIKNSLKEQ